VKQHLQSTFYEISFSNRIKTNVTKQTPELFFFFIEANQNRRRNIDGELLQE
jgi:hypothetical protein